MPENKSPEERIHRQGAEWLVSFTFDGKRHNLGHFQSRREADLALTRRLAALATAQAAKAASRDGPARPPVPAAGGPPRVRDGLVAAEARVPAVLLARLVRYDPATGGMAPRPAMPSRGRYAVVTVAGQRLYAHRVAWALATGEWPRRRLRCLGREADLRHANWRLAGDAEHA